MSKNAAPKAEQDTLFDLGSEVVHATELPPIVPSPAAIRAHQLPPAHHSEAYEELGGGLAIHEPEVRTPEENLELVSIDCYEKSRHFRKLSRQPSSDPELKKAGGKKKSELAASQYMREARSAYLRSQKLPVEKPENPNTQQLEAYYEAVSAWMTFRKTVLEVDSERMALARELSEHVSL